MKSASFLVFLILSMMLIALASALVQPAAAEDPVIVAKWDRTDGADKYTIYANRTAQTVLPGGTYYGTWEYDGPGGYKYIFHWEHGPPGREPFIDYVTVAADGQSYSGYNNYGNLFNCVRVGEIDPVPAADSGFPIVPVAIGGGIAAAAVAGAAAYWYFIAGKTVEAAAGSAEATAGSLAVNEKTKEVAFLDGVTRAIGKVGKTVDNDLGTSQHPDNRKVGGVQKLNLQVEQPELNNELLDQTKKLENKIKEIMPQDKLKEIIEKKEQELKMKSQETQEVADSGESSSNANA